MALLDASGVWKEFEPVGQQVKVLPDVSLVVKRGEMDVITGVRVEKDHAAVPSRRGDRLTRGAVHFSDLEMTSVSPGRLAQMRRAHMGFVCQDFRLIRHLKVQDNVRLPVGEDSLAEGAPRLIERVSMSHRLHQRPNKLSRGEMQRVALARALLTCLKSCWPTSPRPTSIGATERFCWIWCPSFTRRTV